MPFETSLNHLFPYSWIKIAKSWIIKYPDESRKDIVSIDIIHKDFDSRKGILRLIRVCQMDLNLPNWIKRIFGVDPLILVEKIEIDPINKTLKTVGKNITHTHLIQMEEEGSYFRNCDHTTTFNQIARATVTNKYCIFSNRVEKYIIDQYKANAVLGRDIIVNKIEDSSC